jgi:hypothetical protein
VYRAREAFDRPFRALHQGPKKKKKKKKDIEGFLDGFAALGVLTAFEGPSGKRWRAAGRAG